MVIIYNIGIGKGGGKKAQEKIESERPKDNECEGGKRTKRLNKQKPNNTSMY